MLLCRAYSYPDIAQHGGVRGSVQSYRHHDSWQVALPGHRPAPQKPIWCRVRLLTPLANL